MSVAIHVDSSHPTPVYEQLRQQIETSILSGVLQKGSKLPTVRQLASDLGIATGTVMRAYTELETQGLITKKRGGGSVVSSPRSGQPGTVSRLAALSGNFVIQARSSGANDQEIIDAVQEAMRNSPSTPIEKSENAVIPRWE